MVFHIYDVPTSYIFSIDALAQPGYGRGALNVAGSFTIALATPEPSMFALLITSGPVLVGPLVGAEFSNIVVRRLGLGSKKCQRLQNI
jgi:hypothetical protein